jgi:hypothetical protein
MRRFRVLFWFAALCAWGADIHGPVTCTVKGRVVNAITAGPLKKTQISLRNQTNDNLYSATSDETGRFSLTGTEPGGYEIRVQKHGFVQSGKAASLQGTGPGWSCSVLPSGQIAEEIVIRLMPEGVVAGRVVDGDGEPIPGASIQAIQSRGAGSTGRYSVAATATTNDLGEYRIYGLSPGRYYLGAAYRSVTGYAAIYYPASEEVGRALPIEVRPGLETAGLNLTMPETHSIQIRGTVQAPASLPTEGLMIVAAPCDAGPLNRATTIVKGRDGAFLLRDLTPGCYLLAADSFNSGARFSARLPIKLAEANIEDIHLTLVPPVQLSGNIRTEDAADLKLTQVVVNVEARASRVTSAGSPAENGSFLMRNVVPETYNLSVALPDGYYLKSAKVGETDVLQAGLDLSRGAAGQLELEISGAGGSIEGSVMDDQDRPLAGAHVALVPDARAPLRSKSTVTDEHGRFQLRGIAPGDYRMYAAPDLDMSALQDPEYARRMVGQGRRVSVQQHGKENVVLRQPAP